MGKILSVLMYLYMKLVFVTCKWEFRGVDKIFKIWDKEKSIILVGWHGRVILSPFLKDKKYHMDALVSVHRDGIMMANYLKLCGMGIVGGSSNQNAKSAAVNLMNDLKSDRAIFIVPDGPVGPNMRMSISPIYFAKKAQKPLLGLVYSVKNSRIVKKAWDEMMIPHPFSKGIFQVVGPFYIPEDASEDQQKEYMKMVEDKMNEAILSIDKELGVPVVEIGKLHRKKKPKRQ